MIPTIDKKKTGKRIRQLMDARNITVQNVREGLALESTQCVYYWLSGRSLPNIDNLYALSHLLQVPMDDMICGNGGWSTGMTEEERQAGPVNTGSPCRPGDGCGQDRPRMDFHWYDPVLGKEGAWDIISFPVPLTQDIRIQYLSHWSGCRMTA